MAADDVREVLRKHHPVMRREMAEALKRSPRSPIRAESDLIADALLPVVERIAREAAAEALRDAYWATAAIPDPEAVRDVLRARADAAAGGDQ